MKPKNSEVLCCVVEFDNMVVVVGVENNGDDADSDDKDDVDDSAVDVDVVSCVAAKLCNKL